MRPNKKYVFVCGLHRSGTTLLGKNLARLKDCTGLENAGVIMDEGQFLQDVYPPDEDFGGVGKFGFCPAAHLTETSPLLTEANISRLRQSWHAHWDAEKPICVEKTPGNLIKTRFLQAAFPESSFIVLRRHPVAVSLATQKWSHTSLHSLFEHWLRCHKIYEQDKKHLKRVYELTYEDYIADPRKYHGEIAEFIGAGAGTAVDGEVSGAHNRKYFDQWDSMLRHSRCRAYYQFVAARFGKKFEPHGYSLPAPDQPAVPLPFGTLLCWGATALAAVRRPFFLLRYKAKTRLQEARAKNNLVATVHI